MSILQDIKTKINFRQPKYVLPAILYVLVLGTGYFVIEAFTTETAEVPGATKQKNDFLNDKLQEGSYQGDGIGSKYDNMRNAYGTITDASAVNDIDRNEEENKEEYESQYSEEELAKLMAEDAKLKAEGAKGQAGVARQAGTEASGQPAREKEALKELERALAEARLKGQKSLPGMNVSGEAEASGVSGGSDSDNEKPAQPKIKDGGKVREEDAEQQVVKKVKTSSDYFNTLAANEREPNMIKAIIDENVKAVDGSRVRLRLLDDVEIGEAIVPKGSYLYATMSGFGGQRVKGTVKSVMVYDEIVKVNLSLYDADGLEGLYVPESSFRETSKDVASSAMSGSMGISSTSSDNTLEQWGIRAAQNAYSKTASAISKAIKKNRAKLKYGTFVYLINSKEIKTK